MSEKSTVLSPEAPDTEEQLVAGLRALGVTRGDTLIVHCAMHALGWVCGREVAVVRALLRAVGPFGTLVMPAHTGDNSEPSDWQCPPVPKAWWATIRESTPAFDRTWPTRAMGRVAECFRQWPGVKRSAHPQVSWCARGPFARWLLRGHAFGKPCFGPASPLGRMYRRGAKALLIGVGYDHCTCLHLAETLENTAPLESVGAAVRAHGKRVWRTCAEVGLDSDRFPALGAEYERQGGPARIGKVGQADCRLLPVRELVDFGREWLRDKRS